MKCVCVTVVTKHAAACVNACVFDGAMVVKALADLGFSGPLYSVRLLLLALQLVVDWAAAGSDWCVFMSSDMLSGIGFALADSLLTGKMF